MLQELQFTFVLSVYLQIVTGVLYIRKLRLIKNLNDTCYNWAQLMLQELMLQELQFTAVHVLSVYLQIVTGVHTQVRTDLKPEWQPCISTKVENQLAIYHFSTKGEFD